MERHIEEVHLKLCELHDEIGNPRKIASKKKKQLRDSLEQFGDFGIIVVDENNNIISGHQRVEGLLSLYGDQHEVLCKKLIGYSQPELKAINIWCNTHSGEWDMNKLAEWLAELNVSKVNMQMDLPKIDAVDRSINNMELIRYEKYDYVMIVCKNEIDYLNLLRALGIENKKVIVCNTSKGPRKIKARAIWYHEMKANIVPKK